MSVHGWFGCYGLLAVPQIAQSLRTPSVVAGRQTLTWGRSCQSSVGQHRARLCWSLEPRRESERISKEPEQRWPSRGSGEGCFQACDSPAGDAAPYGPNAAFDPGCRAAEAVDAVLLELLHPAVERDGVEPAGEDDASATHSVLRLVPVDHRAHPGRLTAQVDVAGSSGDAGLDECRPIQLVRTNRGDDNAGTCGQRSQAGGIIGIGDNERHLGRCADERATLLKPVSIAPCYCPAEMAIVSVPLGEVFG